MADSRDVTDRRRFACVFCATLLVGGCVRGGTSPAAVVAAYAAALARGDAASAYALLTPAEREQLSLAAFSAQLAANRAEARELAAVLARAPRPVVKATTKLADGSLLTLERGEAGFGVEDPLRRFYDQSSPRAALLAFVRAIERGRWDVLVGLVPVSERTGLAPAELVSRLQARREELGRVAARLWSAREQPIEVIGDRATMPYDESFCARFLLEEGLWRVESPE